MSAATPLVEVEGLRKWFPIMRGLIPRPVAHVKAVEDVSFSIDPHEVLGIAGESGSGKTTIGRTLLRLVEPTDGTIRFRGEDVTRLGPEALRRFRRKAQIVFQDPYGSLNPNMTVEAILSEPLRIQGLCDERGGAPGAGGRASRHGLDVRGPPLPAAPGPVGEASASASVSPGRWRSPPSSSWPTSRCRPWTSPSRPRSSTCSRI